MVTGESFDAWVTRTGAGSPDARTRAGHEGGDSRSPGPGRRALPALGFTGVANVHVGRLIELEVDDPGAAARDGQAPAHQPADRGRTWNFQTDYEFADAELLGGEAEPGPADADPSGCGLRFGVVRFPGSCDEVERTARRRARVGDAVILARRP